jgi:hypothetical protein
VATTPARLPSRWPTVYHYLRTWRLEKALGRGSIELSENACESDCREILSPAQAL